MTFKRGIYFTTLSDNELYSIEYQSTREDAYVSHIRSALCSTLDDFFREISASMRFPDYFGWNWAAFDECITDLDWLKFKSIQIVIDHYELMFRAEKDEEERKRQLSLLQKYLDITLRYWESQGVAFSVIINSEKKEELSAFFRGNRIEKRKLAIKNEDNQLELMLKRLDYDLCVCRLRSLAEADLTRAFFFLARTDEEISLVCESAFAPAGAEQISRGWKGFRIEGVLDFSLVGILARLSGLLAENGVSIFAVSTFNTDYILVKEEDFTRAAEILATSGYTVN